MTSEVDPNSAGQVGAGPITAAGGGAPTHRRRRRVRAMLLAGVRHGLLVGLGGLVVAQGLPVRGRLAVLVDVWLFHLVIGLAVLLVALRPALRRGDRLAWSLVALGVLSWLVGDLWWQATVAPLGDRAPSPNAADGWYLLFYPCVAAALPLLVARGAGGVSRTLWLDGLVAGLGAAAVAALMFDAITAGTGSGVAVLVDFAYPAADLVLLALTLAVTAAQGWRLSPALCYMGAGCLTLVVADTAFLLQEAQGTYVQGSPWDLGWPVAFTLIALAAWQPHRPQASPADGEPALVVTTVVTATSVGVLVAAVTGHVPRLALALAGLALLGATVRTALAVRQLRALVQSRHLALTDELTGLGNRRMLQHRLAELMDTRQPGQVLAVLLLDLDRFKEVNDALGHQVGDELLRGIGPRLAGVLRERDVLARLGGDEFALLLGPGADAAHAQDVAARVREALRTPVQLDGVELHLDVSTGIALCPDHANTVQGLLQCADVAMYEAKHNRSGYELYSSHRDPHDRERLRTIAELHTALDDGQLVCHYQPQWDLAAGQIVAVEALVRWEHPDRGLLHPADFLGLAGQVDLISRLTRRVLGLALADCAQWHARGNVLSVSVNLSALSLSDPTLPQEIARLLRQHQLPAHTLVLEVTEDVMLVDSEPTQLVVRQLHVLGVRLAIDDYGTGYSSLTLLRRLPVHELKLDRSYIAGLGSDARDAAIVKSTVALAHALGLLVVAEGVETADDWQELTRLGCDRAQGHLLSPPLTAARLLAWLAEPPDRVTLPPSRVASDLRPPSTLRGTPQLIQQQTEEGEQMILRRSNT